MSKAPDPNRKVISLPPEWWAAIKAYQEKEGMQTLAEALRRIALAGLRSVGMGPGEDDD